MLKRHGFARHPFPVRIFCTIFPISKCKNWVKKKTVVNFCNNSGSPYYKKYDYHYDKMAVLQQFETSNEASSFRGSKNDAKAINHCSRRLFSRGVGTAKLLKVFCLVAVAAVVGVVVVGDAKEGLMSRFRSG